MDNNKIPDNYEKKLYRWKDNKGKERVSVGIELSQEQQKKLCEKNLALVMEQIEHNGGY